MSVDIFSKKEVEEVAYKSAMLVQNGWRKDYPGGKWLHPQGKKLKTTSYNRYGEKIECEYNEYSLEEAFDELDSYA